MGQKNPKIRADALLVERGIAPTRERAKALILAGVVIAGEKRVEKAGLSLSLDAEITIKGDANPYVSRGGLKLAGALSTFCIDVSNMVALDVGASTGGFTDCLLQNGAKKIYAVDVGYGQIAWKLRMDNRVVLFERTNIRYFTGDAIDEVIDIATIDVSFISLKLVLPVVMNFIKGDGYILALIKPQFEAGKGEAGKKGVVRDPDVHKRIIGEIVDFSKSSDLEIKGICESPLMGPKGNKEFFLFVQKNKV